MMEQIYITLFITISIGIVSYLQYYKRNKSRIQILTLEETLTIAMIMHREFLYPLNNLADEANGLMKKSQKINEKEIRMKLLKKSTILNDLDQIKTGIFNEHGTDENTFEESVIKHNSDERIKAVQDAIEQNYNEAFKGIQPKIEQAECFIPDWLDSDKFIKIVREIWLETREIFYNEIKLKNLKLSEEEPTDEEADIIKDVLQILEDKQDSIKMKIFETFNEASEEEISNAGSIIEQSIIYFSQDKTIQESLEYENKLHEDNLQEILKGKNPDNINISPNEVESNNCKIEEIDDKNN